MKEERIKNLFERRNVIKRGHFVVTSGKHTDTYVDKNALYIDPYIIADLCLQMASEAAKGLPEIIVAPAAGGIVLTQWVAYYLNGIYQTARILSVFVEEDGSRHYVCRDTPSGRILHAEKKFIFKRGYGKLIKGKKICIVDDILTTGITTRGVCRAVEERGGKITSVVVLCNRGEINKKDISVPRFSSLLNLKLRTWEKDNCPLCKNNVPISEEFGKGIRYSL